MQHLPESISLLAAAQRAALLDERGVMVRVLATRGSAPRLAGTMMWVGEQSVYGTVGGGHLEHEAIALARSAVVLPFDKKYPLGASLGQCCGGEMTLRFERLGQQHIEELEAQCAAFKTLYLFGAGHVACAVQRAVEALPLRVQWIDSREAVNTYQSTFPAAIPAHVSTVTSDEPEYELKQAKAGDLALIMTHSHALDERITQAALRNPQLSFIGLIGSATKRRLFEQRLAQRGLGEQELAKLVCPIGHAKAAGSTDKSNTQSKLPAVIAAQVAAQLTHYL